MYAATLCRPWDAGRFIQPLGTTGSTVALVDARGRLRASINYEFPQIYPKPGWVEQRLDDIPKSVPKGIDAVLKKKRCRPTDIAAISITNQGETATIWDRETGEALNNAVVWQCGRNTDFC